MSNECDSNDYDPDYYELGPIPKNPKHSEILKFTPAQQNQLMNMGLKVKKAEAMKMQAMQAMKTNPMRKLKENQVGIL
jgi:hypothetical protein